MRDMSKWVKTEDDLLVVRWTNKETGRVWTQRKPVKRECPLTRVEVEAYVKGEMAGLVRTLLKTRPTLTAHGIQHLVLEATRGQGPHIEMAPKVKRVGRPRVNLVVANFA